MTYSIIAHEPMTGRTGAAVASCVLAIGSRALWGEPGVGVASVQADGGPKEFETIASLLRSRSGAELVVSHLAALASSSGIQVGIVDASGHAASWTGEKCPRVAEHAVGDGATAQGNVLRCPGQAAVMLDAWNQTPDSRLEERLVHALLAGEEHGGDARGRQSAALLVLPASIRSEGLDDPDAEVLSLRVDDHSNPIAELQRLLRIRRAHDELRRGLPLAAERPSAAAGHLRRARELAPDDVLVAQYAALVLAMAGDQSAALSALDAALTIEPALRERLPQLVERDPWAASTSARALVAKVNR